MRLQTVQDALNQKNIRFEYTEEDGLRKSGFHVPRTAFPCVGISRWSLGCRDKISMRQAEARISRAITKKKIAGEILSWPDMINN